MLGSVRTILDEVADGGFHVVLITGVAGLGKTRLVKEIVEGAPADVTCGSARSYRWGATTSFGTWAEALDRALRGRTATELAHLCGGSADVLADLLATVGRVADRPPQLPARDQLLHGLVELLDRMSTQQPVLVALDDLHLADSSSWEALRFIARRLADAPIAVVATARPNELAKRALASEVLLGLEDEAQLTGFELAPLRRAEVAELASAVLHEVADVRSRLVTDRLVTWLMERSLGHPLFVIGLVRALLAEEADLTTPNLKRLPAGLRERVDLDLRAISATERRVLEVVAVVDRPVELEELSRIAALPAGDLLRSLELLAGSWLLDEHPQVTGPTYEISHPIVQDTIYQGIGAARRRDLHRRVARTLLAAGRVGHAAAHFAQAASPGDHEAIAALCRAMAEAEASGLHQEALVTLRALVDLLPAGDERWRQVLEVMDWQPEWVLSHLAENDASPAISAMQRIEEQLQGPDDRTAKAAVRCHLAAFLSFGAGRLAEAEEVCRSAIELFGAADEPERQLLARNELAWIRGSAGDLSGQAQLAGSVLIDATAGGHPRAAVQAAGTAAYAAGTLGRFAEAEELYADSIERARDLGNTYRVAWAHAQLGCLLSLSGDLPVAARSVETAFATDPQAADAIAFEDLAHVHWLAGRFEDALEALERSAVRRPITGSRRRAWGAALAARIHAECGRPERARISLVHAAATYEGRPFLVWGFWERWAHGFLAWCEEGPEAALEVLQEVATELRTAGAISYELLVLVDLVEASAEAGDLEGCERAADRCAAIAAVADRPLPTALAALTAGRCALATSAADVAIDAGTVAVDELGSLGYPSYHGDALVVRGRALARTDRAAGIGDLHAAADVFDRSGASWRRDRTLALLSRFGSRGRRAAAAVQGPASLTPREREVASLASRGYTAAQIADQLYIGRRTVESHLASCYAKLGISSRGELIRVMPPPAHAEDASPHPYAAP